MLRAALLLIFAAAPAGAATRSYSIGSFDRVRVEGPFDVRLATARSPSARAQGDARATDDLDIRVEGATLIVRAGGNGWGERPAAEAAAPVILVSTPMIRGATVIGGGQLAVTGPVRGQRIDLQLTGSGSLAVTGIDADQLQATLVGSGSMKLAGRGAKVRLLSSGSGTIDATPLVAGDLTVRLDGGGDMRATARFTATGSTTGVGALTILGSPACSVKALAGGPMRCGKPPPSYGSGP